MDIERIISGIMAHTFPTTKEQWDELEKQKKLIVEYVGVIKAERDSLRAKLEATNTLIETVQEIQDRLEDTCPSCKSKNIETIYRCNNCGDGTEFNDYTSERRE